MISVEVAGCPHLFGGLLCSVKRDQVAAILLSFSSSSLITASVVALETS